MRKLTRWNQELPTELDHEVFFYLALWHLSAVEDSRIDSITQNFVLGDVRPLLDFDCDYARLSLSDSIHIRQAQAFFSKREDLELGFDKLAVAKEKFRASEEACQLTNDCFRARAAGRFQFAPRTERVLWHASRKISSILGDIPMLSDLRFKFGPGATTQLPKRRASARAKLGHTPACSAELFPLRDHVLAEMPLWRDDLASRSPEGAIPVVIHTGKVAFVPKSAKEYRTIMVEPSLNTMCQAGIGSYMAARLRRSGIDIKDQTRNQKLARKGSLDGSLATVDLSSASDTISIELVYDLLGIDWASFLSRFRTGTAELEGVPIRLQKFSSMGNGFTFPLETLIFYALAYGVCVEGGHPTHDVSAYGDDVIIPSAAYQDLTEVFTACGFTVNLKKSFAQGPFRESCGGDFYQGIDIRPVYQKTRPHTFDLFRLHNFYYRNYAFEVCEYLRSFLHPSIQLFGPDGYGDGHLLGEWVRSRKRSHQLRGYGGYVFDTFSFRPKRDFTVYDGDRVLPAYTTYLSEGVVLSGEPAEQASSVYDRSGRLAVTVPGTSGVNRISVYTFLA